MKNSYTELRREPQSRGCLKSEISTQNTQIIRKITILIISTNCLFLSEYKINNLCYSV